MARQEERGKSSGAERNRRAAPCRPRPPATLPTNLLYARWEGRGARGEGRRERDSLSKRELKCSPANPSQQSRMSDIRVELIRDLGPSQQHGKGALHTEPKPGEAEREQWHGPAPRPGHMQPAMGSAQHAAAGNKDPHTTALHRNTLPRSRYSGGRAGRRACRREETAVDRRWHRARWVCTLRYEVPQHARYHRCRQAHASPAHASRTTLRRACRLLPLAAGKGLPAEAQAAPHVAPLGPC